MTMRRFITAFTVLAVFSCSPGSSQASSNQIRQQVLQRGGAVLDMRGRAELRRDIDRISRDIYRQRAGERRSGM